jgi:hypothetical protein
MRQYLPKFLVIFFSLATLACVYSPANAYVLPGPYILKLMTQNLGKAKRLLVSQKLVLYDNSPQNGAVELNETLRYIFPKTFRSDTLSENVHRIHVLAKGEALTVIDGKVAAEPENSYDRYKDILLFRSLKLLKKRLPLLGVDVTVSSLGRFQGKPAYVLGAQYPDEITPQIWLDKDTFRPLRWIITRKVTERPEDSLEVRYFKWHKVDKAWYPMHIEFLRNDILVREIHVHNIEVAPSFGRELFDIKHIKSTYPPVDPATPDQKQTEKLNEVQKAIEDFKKLYE